MARAFDSLPIWAGSADLPSLAPAPRPRLEEEAQRFAEGGTGTEGVVALSPSFAATHAEARLGLLGAASPVSALPAGVTAMLDRRLPGSSAMLSVHTGHAAQAVARALGAQAWSFGAHIGFAEDSFAPGTTQGDRLIAHEAAHVHQQRGHPPALLLGSAPAGVEFDFSVHVDRQMNSDELLLAFIQQYSRLPSRQDAEAARAAAGWTWRGTPQVADAAAVQRGYVLIRVRDRSLSPATPEQQRSVRETVAGMGETERGALNAETDRRFWETTRYRPGSRLGSSRDDRRMAQYWLQVRNHLVMTRQAILGLPEHVRLLLFDPAASRTLAPEDYEKALRVGQKLANMSATELADWRSRITGTANDWSGFEASLDAYLAEEAERRNEQIELGRLHARLYGLEPLYLLREELRSSQKIADLPSADEYGVSDPTVVEERSRMPERRLRFQTALRENGFANEAEFDAAIAAWRAGFERETVRVADVMLDRLDHVLFEQQRRYAKAPEIAALVQSVAGSGAAAHYTRASEQASRSIQLSRPTNALSESMIDQEGALEAAAASGRAQLAGEAAIKGLATGHPLLGFPDFPRERLARASPEDVQRLVLDYIAAHRESVGETRAKIHSDRDFIYKLDALMRASMEEQGIQPGSIYERILNDHMSQRGIVALLKGIAVAVIAIALTIVTFGGGTVAVAAGAAAFGLSAWQATEAFRDYVRESNAADAQLLSEDPSIGWLVLAVVGAAADLGAATAAVRALRPAAIALNETGDVLSFRQAASRLGEIDARILRAAERGAEAQAAMARQWRALAGIGGRLNDIVGVVAESGYRLMVLAWYGAKRGFVHIDQFLAELERAKVIARVADLTPAERQALRQPFDEGLRRAREGFLNPASLNAELRAALSPAAIDDAAAYGRLLGLSDDEVIEALELQARVAREADPSALSPQSLRDAMRQRAGAPPDELVPDVRGLPEGGTRVVGAIEQSYEIGVAEGRRLLERQGWTPWREWINPFEFNGRYGQGLDDVFVDGRGNLWVVEYKGGTATLSPGQMSRGWVVRNIQRLRTAGYHAAANHLEAALNARTLRGVVISTPHGEAPRIVDRIQYWP